MLDIENWLWKSEFCDLHGRWSAKDLLQWESAIYHSIKLGFEGQVAKKFLNGIYCSVHNPSKVFEGGIISESFSLSRFLRKVCQITSLNFSTLKWKNSG